MQFACSWVTIQAAWTNDPKHHCEAQAYQCVALDPVVRVQYNAVPTVRSRRWRRCRSSLSAAKSPANPSSTAGQLIRNRPNGLTSTCGQAGITRHDKGGVPGTMEASFMCWCACLLQRLRNPPQASCLHCLAPVNKHQCAWVTAGMGRAAYSPLIPSFLNSLCTRCLQTATQGQPKHSTALQQQQRHGNGLWVATPLRTLAPHLARMQASGTQGQPCCMCSSECACQLHRIAPQHLLTGSLGRYNTSSSCRTGGQVGCC
jgi:hypothetical protein